MQIIYFKVECLFPELLPSSTVTLKEVVLTRENEVISTFSNLKINSLPFYSFHLVPVGFRKIEHLIKGDPGKHLQFSSGYLQSGEYRVETAAGEKILGYDALTALWRLVDENEGERYLTTNEFISRDFAIIRPIKLVYRNRRDITC